MSLKVCIDARLISGTYGGVEQFIIGLAHGLSQLSYEDDSYTFLTYVGHDEWLVPFIDGNCRMLSVPAAHTATGGQRLYSRLRRYILNHTPLWALNTLEPWIASKLKSIEMPDDIVERSGFDVVHFPIQRAFITSIPSIYHPWDLQHIHLPQYFTPLECWGRNLMFKTYCKQAQMVAVASEWGRRDLINQYGIPSEKIVVFSGAAPLDAYRHESLGSNWHSVKRKYLLPERYLFYPAQTFQHKNHINLLRALAHLKNKFGLIVPLVCSGKTTDYFTIIQRSIRNLAIDDQVWFVGFVSTGELVLLYENAEIVVFPSQFEGLGMPLLEAFSSQKPIISSSVTCLPEYGGDGAIYFENDSPESMAMTIKRLWQDPELQRIMISRGKRQLDKYSWANTAHMFRQYYKQCQKK